MVGVDRAVELEQHAAKLRACRLCAGVEPPPVVAEPVPDASILLVGQAPGPRERDTSRLFAYTAGTRLFSWFASLGVSEDDFRARVWMSATIRCFPGRNPPPHGGDRAPTALEIATCAPWLEREIALLAPELVLAVGTLAIAKFTPAAPLVERVGRIFPGTLAGCSFDVLALPHPSGRSTWMNRPGNARLLEQALTRLGAHPAWRRTFGSME